jgi:hypothetical protein
MAHKLTKQLNTLYESIIIQEEVAGDHALGKAEDVMADVEQELSEVTMSDAYERHLLEYIQQAKDEYQDDDHDRDDQLCSCSNPYCSLKKGTLPPGVTLEDDLERGIMEFLREHDGDAAVLQEARKDWVEKCSDIKHDLREALRILRRDKRPDNTDDSEHSETVTA